MIDSDVPIIGGRLALDHSVLTALAMLQPDLAMLDNAVAASGAMPATMARLGRMMWTLGAGAPPTTSFTSVPQLPDSYPSEWLQRRELTSPAAQAGVMPTPYTAVPMPAAHQRKALGRVLPLPATVTSGDSAAPTRPTPSPRTLPATIDERHQQAPTTVIAGPMQTVRASSHAQETAAPGVSRRGVVIHQSYAPPVDTNFPETPPSAAGGARAPTAASATLPYAIAPPHAVPMLDMPGAAIRAEAPGQLSRFPAAPMPSGFRAAGSMDVPDAAPLPQRAFAAPAATADLRHAAQTPDPTSDATETRQGLIILDGAQLGRWIIDHLESELMRPGTMTTGIDPRISPTYPGARTGL